LGVLLHDTPPRAACLSFKLQRRANFGNDVLATAQRRRTCSTHAPSRVPGGWTAQNRAFITPPLETPAGAHAGRVKWAQVAQLVEHCTENAGVGGSIPPLGTK
jgi:hypothetical protein